MSDRSSQIGSIPLSVRKPQIPRMVLLPYYIVGIVSTAIGILVVFVLNLSTPLDFIQNRILVNRDVFTWQTFVWFFAPRFLIILCVAFISSAIGIRHLLAPISSCLSMIKKGKNPSWETINAAQRRLLNLSFLFFPVNIIIWILLPLVMGLGSVAVGITDHRTALILSARASMVGFIASAIASQRIEAISRKTLIPFFFPDGHLDSVEGVSKMSLAKRIKLVNRLGAVIPMLIMLVTLLTLQWQLAIEPTSALEYGRGVIVFTIVLLVWTLIFSKQLNWLLSQNIVGPINDMVGVLRQVRKGNYETHLQVLSNDEIGYAGDVVNEMTRDLQDREKMRQSLNLAREVQQNLLPNKNPDIKGLDIAGTTLYCDETGGDYYDYLMPEDQSTAAVRIILGDVSGHGISSALLMATARALFRQRSAMPGTLSEAVTQVNRLLCQDVEDSGNFITFFSVQIDPVKNNISWVRAGHDPALLYDSASNEFTELRGPGVALGIDDTMVYHENKINGLSKGHVLVLYTDGIWEAPNSAGQQFGKDSLYQLIVDNHHLSAGQLLKMIMDASIRFQEGEARQDDATLIIVKFLDDPQSPLSIDKKG
jgi:sigma-B regulation protein RsbU (phosphoserine phosphatase)